MSNSSILWRRLDQPGHDFARISVQDGDLRLTGTAVFVHDQQPVHLDYHVVCDAAWQTTHATITGWLGVEAVSVEITVDPMHQWWINGVAVPAVAGCIDLDLSFSPSTNLLPIRRLHLAVGKTAPVRAAWLRIPHFHLEPLDQIYLRDGEFTYHYESAGGAFVRKLQTNSAGFVTDYPGLWLAEAAL
jgi:hypothetical protein